MSSTPCAPAAPAVPASARRAPLVLVRDGVGRLVPRGPGSEGADGLVRVTTARWARVSAVHGDGRRVEVRADGHGEALVLGLDDGVWTLVAHEGRRGRCSDVVAAAVTPDRRDLAVELPTTIPTARLLVHLSGGDRRPVLATRVLVTDPAGRTVVAPVRDGVADVSDLRPGPVRVEVPRSVGHLGVALGVTLEAGGLSTLRAVVPVGASVVGRVVQHGVQYAAVVTLFDTDGVELERVRTDEDGRFALGRGLRTAQGLTVVATTGPQTLHVTQAAVADVDVVTGVRHDLGDIVLPVAGRPARWTARTPAAAAMRLPSTRV